MAKIDKNMTPEYWQKIKVVLAEVAELEPSSRMGFLETACAGDVELRLEVESFLKFETESDEQLENPAFAFDDDEIIDEPSSWVGKEIGRYRIVSELGRGGMGLVFLAERADGAFDQQVALKLIKRGMDSDAVLERFYNERRILASLVHTNIASLIDGGTTDDGVPYFVMEHVEGKPILEFANDRNLDLDEKLALFSRVATAVAYAHQNLVIHRDLKPSNILVTSDGTPKLLDFGIAKLLTASNGGLVAHTQHFILTPDYASPEQVRGEQLSTATDVYSLGVILFELLTGKRPYKVDSNNFGDIIRVVCETDPLAPSRVALTDGGKLRGDLDNIILKALRKEPELRYSSVEQLTEDIRRHDARLPITAGSGSWRYRLKKFTSRHRYGVVTATLILAALITGFGATLYQANIARRERVRAQQRFNDVRQLANSFMFEINEKIGESPIKARELLVTRALEYLDKLAQESDGDPELQAELATAYEKIGHVQAELFNPSLGKSSDALASHQKSLEIREKLFAGDRKDVSRGADVIKSLMLVGDIYTVSGKIGEAGNHYKNAVALGEQLLLLDPKNVDVRSGLSRSNARLGQNVLRTGSLNTALDHYLRARQISVDLVAENPNDINLRRALSVIDNYIGYVHMEMLQYEAAGQYFRDALEINKGVAATDGSNIQFRGDLATGHHWLGFALRESGDARGGLEQLMMSMGINQKFLEADPANVGYRNNVADSNLEVGVTQLKLGENSKAAKSFETAIKNYTAVWQNDINDLNAKGQILLSQRYLADTVSQSGDLKRAAALYKQTLAEYQALVASDPENTNWQDWLASCELKTGENLLRQKDKPAANEHLRSAVDAFERLLARSPENARLRRDLELARTNLTASN
ncbi:MAG: protein kinase [Chloracidobacterium sp.]|nr:protein kinase [Chloracidobacterium sp.]